jgi:hypothetical protein
MTPASAGVTPAPPGAGRLLSGALVRTTIHPAPLLTGSVNGPT